MICVYFYSKCFNFNFIPFFLAKSFMPVLCFSLRLNLVNDFYQDLIWTSLLLEYLFTFLQLREKLQSKEWNEIWFLIICIRVFNQKVYVPLKKSNQLIFGNYDMDYDNNYLLLLSRKYWFKQFQI